MNFLNEFNDKLLEWYDIIK